MTAIGSELESQACVSLRSRLTRLRSNSHSAPLEANKGNMMGAAVVGEIELYRDSMR